MIENILLHLSLISEIGPATIDKLIQNLTLEQLDNIYYFTINDFKNRCGLSDKLSITLVAGLADKKILERELELITLHKINWTTVISEQYPILLKSIYLPPTVLYWQGTLDFLSDKTIAFVGSRNCNTYGKQAVESLVPELVHDGWTIVSGGALGIDAICHEVALNAGGITCAILGSGLLKPYPALNKQLFEKIIAQNGALISSFSLNQQPLAGNFPSRNRIVAGLSKACIVVQAAEKSGALITANYALEQGKEVGAVPGPITDQLSKGCHDLLVQGAFIASSASAITQALGYKATVSANKTASTVSKKKMPVISFEQLSLEEKIYILCKEPISFDELLNRINCQREELQMLLFNLQIEEKLKQNFMGLWHQ